MNGDHYNSVGYCVVVCLFNLLMVWGYVQQLTDMDLRVRGGPFNRPSYAWYQTDMVSLHSCHYNSSRCLSSVVFTAALRFALGGVFFANGHSSLTLVSLPSFTFLLYCLLFAFGEFRDCFRILNDVSILLVEGEPMTSENLSHNAIYFTKERSMQCSTFLFLLFSNTFLHPNVARVLMGCSVLDMLYHLDLSLLEILFVYIVKMSQNESDRASDLNKGKTKGHILVSGPWDGLYEGPDRKFYPRCSLEIPNRICFYNPYFKNKRGCHVEWVEKASFDRLNKIFEISSVEQNHQVLLTDKNLQAVVKES
ncbi:hypothetical protein AAG906_016721 [Vitis piasezkii]